MKPSAHFRVVNPAVLKVASASAITDCGEYGDAPVCVNGKRDVTNPEQIYRGCPVGQTDCADNSGEDDVCCAGSSWLGPGDNIDHAFCIQRDAEFGGITECAWGDSHRPRNQDNEDCWWDGVHP